jgi:hypothetical protein
MLRPSRLTAIAITVVVVSVSVLSVSPNLAEAKCVRLPWQPKDKCTEIASRRFATPQAKREVARALEDAYTSVLGASTRHKSCFPDLCRRTSSDLQNAVMALGKLMDAYPTAVRPREFGAWSRYYESVKKCFPNCSFGGK